MVLGALLVVSMLGLALVQTVLIEHRQIQQCGRRQQCFWLAEAGARKAIHRLAKSPDYRGEEWVVPADVLGTSEPAKVTISVTGNATGSQIVNVEAGFAGGAVCRREISVHANQ